MFSKNRITFILIISLVFLSISSPYALASGILTSSEDLGITTYELTDLGWEIINWFSLSLVFLSAVIAFVLAFTIGRSLVRR